MKMKVLPPTLRKNSRYLVLDIKTKDNFSKDDFILAIWDSCLRLFGEMETSNFNLWLMRVYNSNDTNDYIHTKAVLRCQRGFEDKVRSAVSSLTKFNGKDIAITTIALSGTIQAAVSKYIAN
ncbi:ribonuclease P [Methanobrevibacter sp. 87.7]|uniref:Rpp14/Pop5 family protein n=1 Tax=Methanobrevibacter sp. 87.7 TaxID=387957 RepID=UPI000B506339|nr:Rpp14/Pop5 family protein [Methanobrevibacter sp. 87.7]OWT32972.1 ribonuclease P [Methanobrevibacter sp. 87.7]